MLNASKHNFPGRVRKYEKLSGRKMPPALWADMQTTRSTRHAIVHRGLRISFSDRGRAQRAVDTGRWAFNWFENRAERTKLRETKTAMTSIGRHATRSVLDAELTSDGVVVHKPSFLADDQDDGESQ
jgi:hypothetical protein